MAKVCVPEVTGNEKSRSPATEGAVTTWFPARFSAAINSTRVYFPTGTVTIMVPFAVIGGPTSCELKLRTFPPATMLKAVSFELRESRILEPPSNTDFLGSSNLI